MIKILPLLLLLISLPLSSEAQDITVPYLDGVPVMNGFEVMPDSILVFDKPEGQITEISLICTQTCPTPNSAYTYYSKAMEGLGWSAAGDAQTHFYKKNKEFRITYSHTGAPTPSVILTFHSNS